MLKLATLLVSFTLAVPAYAAQAGTVTQLAGVLSARKADGIVKILGLQSSVDKGDLLSTGANTYARLKFSDGGELTLRPNTQLKIDDYKFDQAKPQEDNAFFRLVKGGLRAVTGLVGKRNGLENYRMATPTATIGIRGTNYGVLFCRKEESQCDEYRSNEGQIPLDGLYVDVADGRIVVQNQGGSQEFGTGEFGYVGTLTTPPITVPPRSGVPIATDKGTNKPPEAVLEKQADQKDFECTID
ncbi:FecR domain-containing protein [Chitinimonas viridis]|uniref:FecR domain-containing protein n=1 Tax=Chitinimonas viridis TaxID=664880 RepID=A0ABT8B2C7_9NEIS|nr:FecR domain-containing protein [Chitinimonas viridis]MDN3576384.1 FecR domain-containing protein [Chitinimonas viridis]